MDFRSIPVNKCLDKKLRVLGFEVFDILAIFLVLSVLHFIFGASSLKLILVWIPTTLLAVILWVGKRGKPENYLIHWLRFQIKPGVFSAFKESDEFVPPPTSKRRVQ